MLLRNSRNIIFLLIVLWFLPLYSQPPISPVLDTVSVDKDNNKCYISWFPSPSPDVVKYQVYHYDNSSGLWQTLQPLVNAPITNFYDNSPNCDPFSHIETYSVAALNSNEEISQMCQPHHTIYLSPPVIDVCNDKVYLLWNKYDNMNPEVRGYRIYMKKDMDNYILLASVDSITTTYIHSGLSIESKYCYYIQAFTINPTKSSSSNCQCVTPHKPRQPEFTFLRHASVIDNQSTEVSFFVDTTVTLKSYDIERSDDGIIYKKIDNIPATNIYSTVKYIDKTPENDKQSYYYRVQVYDSCNHWALQSNYGKTIYLTGTAMSDNLINKLLWSEYMDRYIYNHSVFRQIDGNGEMYKISDLSPACVLYDDAVENYTNTNGNFKYYVRATFYDYYLNKFHLYDTANSNEIKLIQNYKIFIPNAFCPGGVNSEFKPICDFVNLQDYQFIIYDKWGGKVFETNSPEIAWDGKYKGNYCPYSTYTYYLMVMDSEGIYHQYKGIVNLIR